jgi:hypothetical protein
LVNCTFGGASGGIELDPPAAAVVGLADNKVVRLQLFGDHAEALEAAGLPDLLSDRPYSSALASRPIEHPASR